MRKGERGRRSRGAELDGEGCGGQRAIMLLPAEVHPFLSHEDGFVRNLALDYLWDAHDAGPTTQEDVWATVDRYGKAPKDLKQERRTFARALASFPPTERSTERLFEGLRLGVTRPGRRAGSAAPPGCTACHRTP